MEGQNELDMMKTGRIIQSLSGFYDIQNESGQIERTRARGEFRKSKQKPLVGDFVDYESQNIGYEVILPAPHQQDVAFNQLKEQLQHKVAVFMGQTGAGKSTLLNHLSPELGLETGEVSKALSRGKHTTRKVKLIPVESALIGDTPGFSSYEVFDFSVDELDDYFPEFVAVRQNCQFRGCLHLNEPHCAVKSAVEIGTIVQSRYNNYKSFYDLIKSQKPKYKKQK